VENRTLAVGLSRLRNGYDR